MTDADVQVADGRGPACFRTSTGAEPMRVYTARTAGTSDDALVRVWRPASLDAGQQGRAVALLAGITLAGTLLAAAAGRLGAGRVLQPIAQLTGTAEQVARSGDPSRRVGAAAATDEVGRLLDEVAAAVVRRATERAPRGVRLRAELSPCLVTVDEEGIHRAIGNLVDDAVKRSPDGGCARARTDRCFELAFPVSGEITSGPGRPGPPRHA